MIYVPAIQALYQELAGEAKVLAYAQSLLVDVLGREVLRDAAVVGVAQFYFVILMIEKIIDVNVIYITLNIFEVDIAL